MLDKCLLLPCDHLHHQVIFNRTSTQRNPPQPIFHLQQDIASRTHARLSPSFLFVLLSIHTPSSYYLNPFLSHPSTSPHHADTHTTPSAFATTPSRLKPAQPPRGRQPTQPTKHQTMSLTPSDAPADVDADTQAVLQWVAEAPRWKCCQCGHDENFFDVLCGMCRKCGRNKCGHCKQVKKDDEDDEGEEGKGDDEGKDGEEDERGEKS